VPAESETSFVAILKTLATHRVEFIIVGGVAALAELDARGPQLLMTRFGPLDLLGEIGDGHGYDGLLRDVADFEIHPGVRVHALGLRRLIAVKKETAGPKDLAALPLLERTLDESERA
jgi:predicted nucleotidyltransferase